MNEIIKYSTCIFPTITKIFNLILKYGFFPSTWANSHMTLIHKKGDFDDPGNYRAISITGCLTKQSTSILNMRINEKISNQICNNQLWFRKNDRSSDAIYCLKILTKKYLSKKKKLYICSIDLKKTFDMVW